MRLLLFMLLAYLCSSCATLVNDKHKTVKIFTNKPATVVYQNDTFLTKENKLSFYRFGIENPIEYELLIILNVN